MSDTNTAKINNTMATMELRGVGFHLTGYIMEDGSVHISMHGVMKVFPSVVEAVAYWRDTH